MKENGTIIKIGIGSFFIGLIALAILGINLQGGVDAKQDIQIEQKVDKVQYWRDQDRLFEQLDRIEAKVTK